MLLHCGKGIQLKRRFLPLRKFIELRSLELDSLKYRQASNRKHDECTSVRAVAWEKKKCKLISTEWKEEEDTRRNKVL